jgi:outer membrane protein assembly factor BamE (lipoprotein component of BamABCDE complex)
MLNKIIKIFSIFITLILLSCSTPFHKAQKKIEVGMVKSDVLELMGSPKYTFRRDSQDFWIYRYYHQKVEYESVVVFKHSDVIQKLKPIARPNLLKQAEDAKSMKEYENKILEFQKAQNSKK